MITMTNHLPPPPPPPPPPASRAPKAAALVIGAVLLAFVLAVVIGIQVSNSRETAERDRLQHEIDQEVEQLDDLVCYPDEPGC